MYKDVAKNIDDFIIKYPKTIVPKPTDDDYETGYIDRYYIRKTNDSNGSIFEVNKEVHDEYKTKPFWKVATIRWRIAGPINPTYKDNGEVDDVGVQASNRASLSLAFKNMRNIALYLPNLLQFHI